MSDHVTIHRDISQGTEEWMALRRGILTASEMGLLFTPSLAVASNDKERRHLWELLSQRVTGFVDEHFVSGDMLRGHIEEVEARKEYAAHYGPVEEVGFVVNTRHGFPVGCSPDGLVGTDGLIECKSRKPCLQMQVLVEHVPLETIPQEHVIQVQTALLVTERAWCDYISYCGGLEMATIRVYPDPALQALILEAATAFEERLRHRLAAYRAVLDSPARLIPTERIAAEDMMP